MARRSSKYHLVPVLCSSALAFVLGGLAWAFFELRTVTGNPLILHFDDINGITSVGGWGTIIGIGIFGILVIIMNFLVAIGLDARDRFLGKFLASLTLIFAVLLFIAFAAIINVNV